MLLSSDQLATELEDYSDVVRLALFAHTHMDEIRVLESNADSENSSSTAVPVKLIPSVSPVAGNRPSFLIATIDTKTATMSDYTQYLAPAVDRPDGTWVPGDSFRQTYAEPDFSAASVQELLYRFGTDSLQAKEQTADYIEHYSSGAPKYGIAPVWNSYQCVLRAKPRSSF